MKKLILRFIESFATPELYIGLVGFWNRLTGGKQTLSSGLILKLIANKFSELYFIQIGANDGVKNDPMYPLIKAHHWSGVLVEPFPEFYKQLKKNYDGERQLVFENVGIAESEGMMDYYFLPEQFNDPDWLQQIGSFDRNAIELNLAGMPHHLGAIASKKINVISLKTLMQRNNVRKVDLLIIDAEGFELRILSQLESLDIKPGYIFFEWGCLDAVSLQKLKDFLLKEGYSLHFCGGDVFAIRKN